MSDEAKAEANPPKGPNEVQDVSLGPACLVVAIVLALFLSVAVIGMAVMMSGSQGRRAAYSVREQLIPWVEQSPLDQTDRMVIVERLNSLANVMDREELSSRQLSRLVVRLTDSPTLQWGVIEQLNAQAQASSGMTPEEKVEFSAACDRGLRTASEGKLNLHDMEFAIQNVATKDQRTGRLTMREDVNDERLREFIRRLSTIADQHNISKEPFDKSVSQVVLLTIEDALQEPVEEK